MLSSVQRVLQSTGGGQHLGQLNVMQSAPKGHYRMLSLMLHFPKADDLRCLFIWQPGRTGQDRAGQGRQPVRQSACPVRFVALNSLALAAFSCYEC